MANQHIFNNTLVITGSITASQGFSGDGTGLTGITAVAEWDGTRDGAASITGSLTVGSSHSNQGTFSSIVSGQSNLIDNLVDSSTIGGGFCNVISTTASNGFIGAGSGNSVLCTNTFIGAGQNNVVKGCHSIIGGGSGNVIDTDAHCSYIGGGIGNLIDKNIEGVTIGGGCLNQAVGTYSTVGGGSNNQATGQSTTVGGGSSNTAQAINSAILGGVSNTVEIAHSSSFIVGSNINTTRECTTYVNNLVITGSITADNILQLTPRTTTPGTPQEGMIIASGSTGSSNLYYYNGTGWVVLT